MQHFFIEWFYKTHIIMCRINAFCFYITDGCSGKISRVAKSKYRNIFSVF